MSVKFGYCRWCKTPLLRLTNTDDKNHRVVVEQDSLTCQDMADIEDGIPLFYEQGRHRRHERPCKGEPKHDRYKSN